jgi:hypothetical protein
MKENEIKMSTQSNATYCEVPIVARSPSYQQPVEEAEAQTREALRQRTIRRG